MYQLVPESNFKKDYKSIKQRYPQIVHELKEALLELQKQGKVPESYNPHILDNPNGSYNNHMDFHLSDGKVDVIVLYLPHKTNPAIRLVRIGPHSELFKIVVRAYLHARANRQTFPLAAHNASAKSSSEIRGSFSASGF